jgi:hypothetical protein
LEKEISMPLLKTADTTRLVRKVRQTQHQNLELGHTEGENFKKPAKKYIRIEKLGEGG